MSLSNRSAVSLVALAAVCISASCAAPPIPPDVGLLLQTVHIVDPVTGRTRHNHTIAIRRDSIVAIVPDSVALPYAGRATVVDAKGAFAIPGLWDAHVHVQQGGGEVSIKRAARLLGHGITHARDMGASLGDRTAFITRVNNQTAAAPQLLSAGPTFWAFSLPYGDASAKVIVSDTGTTQAAVDSIAKAGVDFLKVYAGFTADRLGALVKAARRRGLTVAGHAQPDVTLEAHARLGVVTVEHLDFSTLAECTTRSTSYFDRVIAARFRASGESVPAILTAFAADVDTPQCRTALRRAARSGLVLVPTLATTYLGLNAARDALAQRAVEDPESCALYLRDFEGAGALTPDSVPAAGQRLMRMVREAGVTVLAGSDTPAFCVGAGDGLLLELQLLANSGYTPLEVLQSATVHPSRVLAPAAQLGQLRPGTLAHVLLLRSDPLQSIDAYREPVGVYTRGRWRDAAALRALRNP